MSEINAGVSLASGNGGWGKSESTGRMGVSMKFIVWMYDSNEGAWYDWGRFQTIQEARAFMKSEKKKVKFKYLLTELLDEF